MDNGNVINKDILNIYEFCQYMRIGENTARKLLKKQKFAYKIGNRWYIKRNLLEEWINGQCRSDDKEFDAY